MPADSLFLVLGAIFAGGVATFALIWIVTGLLAPDRCPGCRAFLRPSVAGCDVCGMAQTRSAHTLGLPTREDILREWRPTAPKGHHDPKAGFLNHGTTRRALRLATIIVFVGLGLRIAGMAGTLGTDFAVPRWIDATLTVIGGLAAFVGFSLHDAA